MNYVINYEVDIITFIVYVENEAEQTKWLVQVQTL
jgi:hypothetical protein